MVNQTTNKAKKKIITKLAPSAQFGIARNSLLIILSIAFAWTSTPGKIDSNGVARKSSKPAADVPIKIILSLISSLLKLFE